MNKVEKNRLDNTHSIQPTPRDAGDLLSKTKTQEQEAVGHCMPPKLTGSILAKDRSGVFRPDLIYYKAPEDKVASENARLKLQAFMELQLDLRTAGMTPGMVLLYTQLLWKCGEDCNHPVYAKTLAADTHIARPSVSRLLKLFTEMGVAEPVDPNGRPTFWRFPVYDELMARTKAWSDSKVQQKGGDALPPP